MWRVAEIAVRESQLAGLEALHDDVERGVEDGRGALEVDERLDLTLTEGAAVDDEEGALAATCMSSGSEGMPLAITSSLYWPAGTLSGTWTLVLCTSVPVATPRVEKSKVRR